MFRDQRDVDRWHGLDPDTGDDRPIFPPKRTKEVSQNKPKSAAYLAAWSEGQDAVRRKPLYAPSNPYEDTGPGGAETEQHNGWEDGAISAGICDIYTNGVLHKSERR